jgi:uncharacterized protein with gpF-like domain
VRDAFQQASGARARAIARTEVVRASNYGVLVAADQAEVPKLEWLATADQAVRDSSSASHVALNGQVVDRGRAFVDLVSGNRGPHPGEMTGGAKMNANCRCAVLPLLDPPGDKAGPGTPEGKARLATAWKAFDERRREFERRAEQGVKAAFEVQARRAVAALTARSP